MTKALPEGQIGQYWEKGYVFPVPVLSSGEAASLRSRLEVFEATQGGGLKPAQRAKSHLLFKWLDDLMRDSRVLDPIEDLIGPNVLCWNTIFWIKEPGSNSFVSWHQDLRYWGLAGGEVVSAWIALSPASVESGCMRVLPGSHKGALFAHEDRYDEANMLTRGQEVTEPPDEAQAVHMPLRPGEMSLHSGRLAHASGPNASKERRIGISLHYMPTRTYQKLADWDSAALVRGQDDYGHFHLTPRPAGDFAAEAVAFHDKASAILREILYRDAARRTGRL